MNHKIIRTALALLFVSFLIAAPRAQQPAPVATTQSQEDRVALYQALLDLTNPWTVMCFAAHPDDEDGTSLIVMRRKYGAHTVSVFSTFGEGGQNAIGPELYEELGAIRARETMAAAEIQGSEPYFLGLKDFGYSKSADETFKKWGHNLALSSMVLQIRKLCPNVIITNHSVTNNDHGHHQATARLAVEAFDAAADPEQFPEQLKDGVTAWQVQRLFVRVFDRRGANGQREQTPVPDGELVTIDPNERDPISGAVYAEEALQGLQKHATQGPWPKTFADLLRFRNSQDGKLPMIRYRLVRQAKDAAALPTNSHNVLDGLQIPDQVAKWLALLKISDRPFTEFVDQHDKVLTELVRARKTDEFETLFRKQHPPPGTIHKYFPEPLDESPGVAAALELMLERLNIALAEAGGVKAELRAQDGGLVVRGREEPLVLRISNNGSKRVRLEKVAYNYPSPVQLEPAVPTVSRILNPGESKNFPMPSRGWLIGLLPNEISFGSPEVKVPLNFGKDAITLEFVIEDARALIPVASHLTMLPEIEITNVTPKTVVSISARRGMATFSMQVLNNRATRFNGRIAAYLSQHYDAVLATKPLSLSSHETRLIKIDLPATNKTIKDGSESMTLPLPYEAAFYAEDDFPKATPRWQAVGQSSEVTIGVANARVSPNVRLGYIRGFDYSLPDALASLSVESKELSVDDVKTADLSKFTAVIVDNRVYESQPELIAANQKLLDYAKDGGTLIVFYHKTNEWNPDPKRNRPQLAPYNLVFGDERITDENAPVTFIEPQHPLLNFPNRMGQEDFAGWIQERGLYYPKEWDAHYTALLASNDPGEQPLRGGLLVADYGRGHYIYTSMVWYRQLRAGVPGAYRMLANMISYGQAR